MTIIEFPSPEQALAWYNSPEYAPLKALRLANSSFDTFLVEGLDEGEPATLPERATWDRAARTVRSASSDKP